MGRRPHRPRCSSRSNQSESPPQARRGGWHESCSEFGVLCNGSGQMSHITVAELAPEAFAPFAEVGSPLVAPAGSPSPPLPKTLPTTSSAGSLGRSVSVREAPGRDRRSRHCRTPRLCPERLARARPRARQYAPPLWRGVHLRRNGLSPSMHSACLLQIFAVPDEAYPFTR